QCVPVSGSCDCSAASAGMEVPCPIVHPFGTCTGQRLCEGDSGWSACEPPAADDEPDADFVDANCDGIDGALGSAIFVAPGGIDTESCGASYLIPCATIPRGIERAVATGRDQVYIQAGSYLGAVELA